MNIDLILGSLRKRRVVIALGVGTLFAAVAAALVLPGGLEASAEPDLRPGIYRVQISGEYGPVEAAEVSYIAANNWVKHEDGGDTQANDGRYSYLVLHAEELIIITRLPDSTGRLVPVRPVLDYRYLAARSAGRHDNDPRRSSGVVAGGGGTGYVPVPERMTEPGGPGGEVVYDVEFEAFKAPPKSAQAYVQELQRKGYRTDGPDHVPS